MNELSMHILDIVQNSIYAESKLVQITVIENLSNNILQIDISDDGCGMDSNTLKKASDPFYTSRTTRKVGLGISLFKMSSEMCEGTFVIDSKKAVGTKISATYKYDHIDRAPLGNMEDTIFILSINDKGTDILYKHIYNDNEFVYDTREIKAILNDVPLTEYSVMLWIKENINQGIVNLHKEGNNL